MIHKTKPVEWILALLLCSTTSLIATYILGKDLNWDAYNYHLFAGLSVFQDRLAQDFFPASIQTYLNPVLYAPFYWMVTNNVSAFTIAGTHAVIHAINVVFLYFIAKLVIPSSERHPRLLAAALTLLGCLTSIFWSELGSTFMDATTSVLVLGAAYLTLRIDERRSPVLRNRLIVIAGLLLGAATGLKLTNIVFAVAGGLTLALAPQLNTRQAIKRSLLALLGLAVGFFASFGAWGFQLYKHFENPFFPFFNSIFKSDLFPPVSLSFTRFVPTSWQDWLYFPLRMAEHRSWHYTESVAPDLRPTVLIALVLLIICTKALRWRAHHLIDPAIQTPGKKLAIFCSIAIPLWMMTSANGRYAFPLLLLIGPLLGVVAYSALPSIMSRIAILIIIVLQAVSLITVGNPRWAPEDWTDSWFEVQVPEKLVNSPHLYLTIGTQSNSFLAAFVHRDSSFVNFIGQHAITLQGPAGARFNALLSKHSGKTRALISYPSRTVPSRDSRAIARINFLMTRVNLEVDADDCVIIESDGRSEHGLPLTSNVSDRSSVPNLLLSCALTAKSNSSAETENIRRDIEKIYRAFEKKCPTVFRPRGSVPESVNNQVWAAYYMESDVYLVIANGMISHYMARQPVDTVIGPVDSWQDHLTSFVCKLPRQGSREF